MRAFALVAAVASVMLAPPAQAQSAQERARLNELDADCYKARIEKIRMVQAQRIEECVQGPPPPRTARWSRADCERYWGDYGWSAGVGTDLPTCKAAFEARQQHRAPARPSRPVP